MQDAIIADLRAQVKEMESGVLSEALPVAVGDVVEEDAGGRIELESSLRRIELLQISLDEVKGEAAELKNRNGELEKKCHSLQLSRLCDDEELGKLDPFGLQQALGRVGFDDADESFGCPTSSDGMDIDQLKEDLRNVQHTLRERSTQLKVVMDTLEAVQSGGMRTELTTNILDVDHDEIGDGRRREGGLAGLGGLVSTASSGPSWTTHALVKRSPAVALHHHCVNSCPCL